MSAKSVILHNSNLVTNNRKKVTEGLISDQTRISHLRDRHGFRSLPSPNGPGVWGQIKNSLEFWVRSKTKNYSAFTLGFGPRFRRTTRRPESASISVLKRSFPSAMPWLAALRISLSRDSSICPRKRLRYTEALSSSVIPSAVYTGCGVQHPTGLTKAICAIA